MKGLLPVLLMAACAPMEGELSNLTSLLGGAADTGEEGASPTSPPDSCAVDHILELVPLDIWGQDLASASIIHDGTVMAPTEALAPASIWLGTDADATVFNLALSAADHLDTTLQLVFTQDDDGGHWEWSTPTGRARATTFSDHRIVDGHNCPFTTVFIGLDHAWFAATAPPPSFNELRFFIGGAPFFEALQRSLETAHKRVSWSTWWWESDFELSRPDGHLDMTTYERRSNTAMALLNAIDGTERRILVNRFYESALDWDVILNTDEQLLDRAEQADDDFQVILQGNTVSVPTSGEYSSTTPDFSFASRVLTNPRYTGLDLGDSAEFWTPSWSFQAASWHQKFVVIDGKEAFLGGHNIKALDWDTAEHLVFDHRRMDFDATTDERLAVSVGSAYPDGIPRRDYGVHLIGPAARDLEGIFVDRWDLGIDDGSKYAENATRFSLDEPHNVEDGGTLIQVVRTSPTPLANQSILESHQKALKNASRHVIIEDQYFRAPDIEDELKAAMLGNPALRLTVVTNPVEDWDPGLKYTHLADATFRGSTPERYQLFTLRTSALTISGGWFGDDVAFHHQPINIHSKLRLVDDKFIMVGSANWNNRGMKYEGETNIHILDADMATSVREAVLANWVGPRFDDLLSDDPENNFDVLAMAAEWNAEVAAFWEEWADSLTAEEAEEAWAEIGPSGLIYPLEISSDWIVNVGPDLF
jgi:hypothetical protein